jgi:hypothetical protein
MSDLTEKEWEYIDKEAKAIIAALAGIWKEMGAIRGILEGKQAKDLKTHKKAKSS